MYFHALADQNIRMQQGSAPSGPTTPIIQDKTSKKDKKIKVKDK